MSVSWLINGGDPNHLLTPSIPPKTNIAPENLDGWKIIFPWEVNFVGGSWSNGHIIHGERDARLTIVLWIGDDVGATLSPFQGC